jgi:hypothetical protein
MFLVPTSSFAADANPDAAFYKKAAEGGIAEVELGPTLPPFETF